MKKQTFQIREYGTIRNTAEYGDESESSFDELYLPANTFKSLYSFIQENQAADVQTDPPFSLFTKSGKQQIKVKNYVGIIETADGVAIEILPKISTDSIIDTKRIFMKMLSHLKNSPFINIKNAHLNLDPDFPVLEAFIRNFIEETERVFSRGIKSNYLLEEENLNFFKGKLMVTSNIKLNSTRRSRFFCQYDEYSQNIPQNRIIKSALLKLSKITKSYQNLALISKLLTHLDSIEESKNIYSDLKVSGTGNKTFKSYEIILQWSEIFLLNKTFTNFKGKTVNLAMLFPMEKIFENYIEYLFKKFAVGFTVYSQDTRFYLVEKHKSSPKFRLKPDLYLENDTENRIVIDTKWKLLDASLSSKNYNISQADMYQLFAYGKKYSTGQSIPRLILIYPYNTKFTSKLDTFHYDRNLNLEIIPFNLEKDAEREVNNVLSIL